PSASGPKGPGPGAAPPPVPRDGPGQRNRPRGRNGARPAAPAAAGGRATKSGDTATAAARAADSWKEIRVTVRDAPNRSARTHAGVAKAAAGTASRPDPAAAAPGSEAHASVVGDDTVGAVSAVEAARTTAAAVRREDRAGDGAAAAVDPAHVDRAGDRYVAARQDRQRRVRGVSQVGDRPATRDGGVIEDPARRHSHGRGAVWTESEIGAGASAVERLTPGEIAARRQPRRQNAETRDEEPAHRAPPTRVTSSRIRSCNSHWTVK